MESKQALDHQVVSVQLTLSMFRHYPFEETVSIQLSATAYPACVSDRSSILWLAIFRDDDPAIQMIQHRSQNVD
jgi:hypothetical protein